MNLTNQQKTDAEKALLVVLESWGCSRHKDDFPMLQSELAKVGLAIISTSQKPLSAGELIALANGNISVPPMRALATFADESNWTQLYEAKSMKDGYTARACEWGFIGPVRPPFELAQWALKAIQPIEKEKE